MKKNKEIEEFQKHLPIIKNILGWSDKQMGEKIGISRQSVNNLIHGRFALSESMYRLIRYVIDDEINAKPKEETEMIRLFLDAFIDNPNQYSVETKDKIYKETDIYSSALGNKKIQSKEVSNRWRAALISIGAITIGALAAIVAGRWKK